MIAKFPGTCIYCRRPITVGKDIYDVDARQNWHEACHESQPPDPADYEKAESLGFRDYDELMKESE